MTFRIDRVHLTEVDDCTWLLRCWFKGFMGTKEHASAEHRLGTDVLTIRSSRPHIEAIEIHGFQLDFDASPRVIREAVAARLECLGWGPEVNAYGRPTGSEP